MDETKTIFKGVRFNLLQKGRTQWVDHPGAVVILPLLDETRVVMIRNFRVAVDQELWELPAGTLEPDEPPLTTAFRELEEETGYVAQEMESLPSYYMSPGINNEVMYPYIARNLTLKQQNLDEGEQIRVEVVTWPDLLKLIQNGTVKDAKTITTCLYYRQNKV